MKSLYLVGASSFLGSNIEKHFKDEFQILCAPKYPYDGNFDAWKNLILDEIVQIRPNVVIIAGASQDTGDNTKSITTIINSNCVLPCSIASRIIESNIDTQLVVFGSSWQYSDSQNYRPFNFYAASKQACDDLLQHFALKGLKIASLMLFDTYGPDDTRPKLLNLLLRPYERGQVLEMTFGEQEIDLVCISDVCDGLRHSLEELNQWDTSLGIMSRGLGSGRPIKVKMLVERVGKLLGRSLNVNYGRRAYRDREPMTTYKNFQIPKNWKISDKTFHHRDEIDDD